MSRNFEYEAPNPGDWKNGESFSELRKRLVAEDKEVEDRFGFSIMAAKTVGDLESIVKKIDPEVLDEFYEKCLAVQNLAIETRIACPQPILRAAYHDLGTRVSVFLTNANKFRGRIKHDFEMRPGDKLWLKDFDE